MSRLKNFVGEVLFIAHVRDSHKHHSPHKQVNVVLYVVKCENGMRFNVSRKIKVFKRDQFSEFPVYIQTLVQPSFDKQFFHII